MKKILFIEDELALQKTFGEILRQENYEMISALDGEKGLKMAESEKPDLILLDLILPKIHGFDVLRQLRENKVTMKIPVIVLTNLERVEDVDKAIKLGATTYLVKAQYKLEEVIKKIEKVFSDI